MALASATNPATGGTVNYHYDNDGAVSSMDYPSPSTGSRQTTYFAVDDHGRRTDEWVNASADHTSWKSHIQTAYDTNGHVTSIQAFEGTGNSSNTRIVFLSYCYAVGTTVGTGSSCTNPPAANNRNEVQWSENWQTHQSTAYTYDNTGRLYKATQAGGASPHTFTYGYNSNGARTSASDGVSPAQNLTYNAANQITSTGYSYDGAGNVIADPSAGTMTYNYADQLASVTRSGNTYSYTYSGQGNGQLVSQTTPNGTYKFAYGRTDGQGNPVLEEVAKDGRSASVISDPVTGQPLLLQTTSGIQANVVYDGTPGSPVAIITDGSHAAWAADYNPWGTPVITQSTAPGDDEINAQMPYTFSRGLLDRTTGWVRFNARYYNPGTGNWTQQDRADKPLDPRNGNRYAYAGDDPINRSDPSGNVNWDWDDVARVAVTYAECEFLANLYRNEFNLAFCVINPDTYENWLLIVISID